jgi:hypothetical protein
LAWWVHSKHRLCVYHGREYCGAVSAATLKHCQYMMPLLLGCSGIAAWWEHHVGLPEEAVTDERLARKLWLGKAAGGREC